MWDVHSEREGEIVRPESGRAEAKHAIVVFAFAFDAMRQVMSGFTDLQIAPGPFVRPSARPGVSPACLYPLSTHAHSQVWRWRRRVSSVAFALCQRQRRTICILIGRVSLVSVVRAIVLLVSRNFYAVSSCSGAARARTSKPTGLDGRWPPMADGVQCSKI